MKLKLVELRRVIREAVQSSMNRGTVETMEQIDPVAIYSSYDVDDAFKRRLRKAGFKLTSRDGMGSYYNPVHWRYIGMGIPAEVDEKAMEADPEYVRIQAMEPKYLPSGELVPEYWDAYTRLIDKYTTSEADAGDFWADQDAWKALTPEALAWAGSDPEL
jgi:hypothetical protein